MGRMVAGWTSRVHMGVNPKIVLPPNHPFVHRVFHYFYHPFWGKKKPIFGNSHIWGVSFKIVGPKVGYGWIFFLNPSHSPRNESISDLEKKLKKNIPSLKLTFSPLKMMVSNRSLLFQGSIFRGYVSFREGNLQKCIG